MLDELLNLAAAAGAGAVAGGLVSLISRRRLTSTSNDEPDLDEIDPGLGYEVDRAAKSWATATGRPGAERLVAGKLRLAARLQQQQRRQRDGRSS